MLGRNIGNTSVPVVWPRTGAEGVHLLAQLFLPRHSVLPARPVPCGVAVHSTTTRPVQRKLLAETEWPSWSWDGHRRWRGGAWKRASSTRHAQAKTIRSCHATGGRL